DGVLVWPELLGHGLVDDNDGKRAIFIAVREESSGNERRAERTEVARRGGVVAGMEGAPRSRLLSLNAQADVLVPACPGQITAGPSGFDSGQVTETGKELLKKL